MGEQYPLLRIENTSKSFGITKALKSVSLEIKKGQILGLLGENGSGKSTLASIISSIYYPNSGRMFFKGKPYNPKSSIEANDAGICMLMQEKGTFDHLSVAQNIFIGKERLFSKFGLLNTRAMNNSARTALEAIGITHIDPETIVSSLGFEDRKMIELARAVNSSPSLLIVDETTTAIGKRGRDILFSIIRKMRDEGNSVIFISHDLEEMMDTCDDIFILRDGVHIDTLSKNDFNVELLKKLMVGRELTGAYYRDDEALSKKENGENALIVDNLSAGVLDGISFSLKKGEILGIAGLADCGIHDLGKAVFGAISIKSGEVKTAEGNHIADPRNAMKSKLAYISKDRDQESLMISASISENICLASYHKLKKGFLVSPKKEKGFVKKWSETLSVKMRDSEQYVTELSGGNKQKVVLAKWLGFGADIFILDCPTRGIDVGVKANIYQLMMHLKSEGKSILLISEELTELIGMADRVLTIKDGKKSNEFFRENNITENDLIEFII